MYRIVVNNVVSLHRRISKADRERLVAEIRRQLPPHGLSPGRDYRLRIEVYGKYRTKTGKRKRKDRSNVAYRFLNLIAEAGRVDDSVFGNERPNELTVTGAESEREYVIAFIG
jgi:hypothetical protein